MKASLEHRRKLSSPWRCVSRLRFGAYAVVVLLLLEAFERFTCEMLAPRELDAACPTIGPWLSWVAIGVMVASAIACASQGWQDFHKHQHTERRF